ncbi:MAG TPA: restriction endonuclease subunit S [Bacillus bacterium]|uniref:restriction endonuclease subunit S n=1 Tax=Siminovitchia fordii TaxID=254759 RepID=UPI00035DA79C|nr:restriction endonuclease subunit S [Siminovitchia fordii]HBZ08801.1 restriction endonuclease subunit S [Bacillus sp. (in: firmicutes)]
MAFKWPELEIEKLAATDKNAIAMGPFGSRIKTDNFVEFGVPVIKGQNLTKGWLNESGFSYLTEEKAEELRSSLAVKGDIVFTHRGTLGQIGYIHEDSKFNRYIVSQSQMKLSLDKDKILPLYLYYFFKSRIGQHRLLINTSQTGVPAISRPVSTLKKIKVPVPPMNEQKKITEMLKSIDLKINLNDSIISNLEELAQTIFKRWFVDFEFPNENGEPYKSSGGEMVESELGMIPKGWHVSQLEQIVKHSKQTFNPKKVEPQEVAHFSLPAFDQQKFYSVERSDTIKSNKYYINNYSLMFSKMNPSTPRIWLPKIKDGIPNVCSTEFVVLDTSDLNNRAFVHCLIASSDFTIYLKNNATGSTNSRQRVNPTTAIAYKFPYDEGKTKEFEALISPLLNKVLLLREQTQSLINLRDTLLPKLLSGEIELPDETEVIEHVPVS